MDGAAAATSFWIFVQILFLDLLLSGDNALVIALACRRLPPEQARRAAWIGAAGAIGLRLVLTLMAGALMTPAVPAIAERLAAAGHRLEPDDRRGVTTRRSRPAAARCRLRMLAAAGIIVVSDAAMSLDNVVALAAVSAAGSGCWFRARGQRSADRVRQFRLLHLMKIFPLLVTDLGGAMLGWIAGGMIVERPSAVRLGQDAGARARFRAAFGLRGVRPAAGPPRARERPTRGRVQSRNCPEGCRSRRRRRPRPRPVRLRRGPPARNSPVPGRSWQATSLKARSLEASSLKAKSRPTRSRQVRPNQIPPPWRHESTPDGDQAEPGDRWMIFGLIALFVVFGLFLTAFVLISD